MHFLKKFQERAGAAGRLAGADRRTERGGAGVARGRGVLDIGGGEPRLAPRIRHMEPREFRPPRRMEAGNLKPNMKGEYYVNHSI